MSAELRGLFPTNPNAEVLLVVCHTRAQIKLVKLKHVKKTCLCKL